MAMEEMTDLLVPETRIAGPKATEPVESKAVKYRSRRPREAGVGTLKATHASPWPSSATELANCAWPPRGRRAIGVDGVSLPHANRPTRTWGGSPTIEGSVESHATTKEPFPPSSLQ